tara:strand:- start:737 stop:2518 length:1782 start_codon:yes stop_codon:yes gene_type:complete
MAKKRTNKLEPFIDPKTKLMRVGSFTIPPSTVITGLLVGFANHTQVRQREYYFWRICDELWNNSDLPEPLMVKHPWAELMIREALKNKYLAIGGAASSSKSHTMAAFGIVCWLSRPHETLVLITSTTLREARKRIWGSVISLMAVIEDVPGKIRDSIGNIAYVDQNGNLFERAGLSLIAAEKSKTREAVGKMIGIKQKNLVLLADELSEMSENIVSAALSNLSKNPELRVIGMSNPASRFDAFGVWSEPKDGWDTVSTQTDDSWRTKWGGKYLRLDGERSPNLDAGFDKYPFLPTQEKLEEDRAILGEESRAYMRMVRAVFFDGDEDETIYSEQELIRHNATQKADWQGKPTVIAGLDPAFTNGGDRTVLYLARVGYTNDGEYCIEFGESFMIRDDASNKAIPRTYQIVTKVIELCKKHKVSADNLAVDATGAGAPFCDVLAGEWSSGFLRVSFGGKPSDKRVGANSKLTGVDLYTNRVSELWFVGKELMRTRQLRGVDADLGKEICARSYELVKTGTLKVKIESKVDYKSRMGRSPDLADAAFLALDCARQRMGLVAVEPAERADGSGLRVPQRKTIKSIRGSLDNPEGSLS